MNIKKFIPCIYLYHTHAVTSLKDTAIVDTDPVRLAKYYCHNNADELIVFDMSVQEDEQVQALDVIKDICANVEVDVIGAGNISRMEDVKKLLYAGCKKVVLNHSKQSNVDLTQEVSLKFGKEKILASYNDCVLIKAHQTLLEEYVSQLLLMNVHIIRETAAITGLPAIVQINQLALNKLLEMLSHEMLSGITGNVINGSVKEILALKDLCKEHGILVETLKPLLSWQDFKLNAEGLLPVIVQDYKTLEVLMMAYMNEESFLDTMRTGKMTYFSRSRQELWLKGETSGNFQYVKSLDADCDKDTLLAKVSQVGAACHTGSRSCFFEKVVEKAYEENQKPLHLLEEVFDVIKDRKSNPKKGSYTNYLFEKGLDKILKKLGEEATEIVIAAKNPNPNEIKYEISDFLYHMMVLMAEKNISWDEIMEELGNR